MTIKPEMEAKMRKDWSDRNYPSAFQRWWIDEIEYASTKSKVTNDSELLLCLEALHKEEKESSTRDGGSYERFLQQIISYFNQDTNN